jgi:hypothetical protein
MEREQTILQMMEHLLPMKENAEAREDAHLKMIMAKQEAHLCRRIETLERGDRGLSREF